MRKPFQIVPLQDCSDQRGRMHVITYEKEIPFEVKRTFFMYQNTESSVRGDHANMRSRMAFVCMQGSCRLTIDDGEEKYPLQMDSPDKLVSVEAVTWKTIDRMSADCILMVFSDLPYSDAEIEHDYEAFRAQSRTIRK